MKRCFCVKPFPCQLIISHFNWLFYFFCCSSSSDRQLSHISFLDLICSFCFDDFPRSKASSATNRVSSESSRARESIHELQFACKFFRRSLFSSTKSLSPERQFPFYSSTRNIVCITNVTNLTDNVRVESDTTFSQSTVRASTVYEIQFQCCKWRKWSNLNKWTVCGQSVMNLELLIVQSETAMNAPSNSPINTPCANHRIDHRDRSVEKSDAGRLTGRISWRDDTELTSSSTLSIALVLHQVF